MHITETLQVAAAAWEHIKPAEDPSFNNCSLTHRENLIAKAEAAIRTRSGDDDFERAVLAILAGELQNEMPPIAASSEQQLRETIASLEQEVAHLKESHASAAALVAKMHAVVVGKVKGPSRGVIEDVEDTVNGLRARISELETGHVKSDGATPPKEPPANPPTTPAAQARAGRPSTKGDRK